MRKVEVYRNNDLAGLLIEESKQSYLFRYDDIYYSDKAKPAISLTMPKIQQEYKSKTLFPFFFNMLSEGANKKLQCTRLKIDPEDSFGLLAATSTIDTIGAITIKPIK
ncbi:MAG TPA: HipA N-terminal domain-containing protein [Bacteroidales bacterium]|nr:HipA N-terminal domain-containing protein [Bacteroidales bacterium]